MAGATDIAVEVPQHEETSLRPKSGLDILLDRLDQAPPKLDKKGNPKGKEGEKEYLKEVMPQVVSNIIRIVEANPDIDRTQNGDPEFYAKRVSDLKKLMSFDFVHEGEQTEEEKILTNAALLFVNFMINPMSYHRSVPYSDGINVLLSDLRKKDQGLTHEAASQIPEVTNLLIDHAESVWQALYDNYEVIDEHRYNLSMTFYARRVDPKYYQEYEDWDYGLRPDKPVAGEEIPSLAVRPNFWDQVEEALNRGNSR